MRGAAGRGIALLMAAAAATSGCCGTGRGVSARENRDTPRAAFDYVRAAFAEDRIQDQFDSLHPDFVAGQGLSRTQWALARDLRPGLFERAAALLGRAALEEVGPPGTLATSAGPRPAVRIALTTGEGGRGEFVLVDEPVLWAWTDDPGLPSFHHSLPDMGRLVRIEEGRIRVALSVEPTAVELLPAAVRRIEIHHDWLLYRVERLEGFDELVDEVRSAAEETESEEGDPQ